MTDEEYGEFVEFEKHLYSYYARSLNQNQNKRARQLIWLRIIGLMETWDMME